LQLQALNNQLNDAIAAGANQQDRLNQLQRALDAGEAERKALQERNDAAR